MGKLAHTLDRVRAVAPKKLAWLAVLPLAALSWFAIGQSTPSAHPTIPLASEPLYARGTRDKPTLTLALSVEFPTVGALYTNPADASNDATYTPANEYIGYFDADSCYRYNNTPTEVASSDSTYSNYKRFDRSGAATKRECAGAGFSGNFMNWATSSAVDILRMGLTGGDRWIDTANNTVLQRAVLNRGSMYNDSYFPSKRLVSAHAAGAVPAGLRGTHTGDIYVANCLDRVHFGTARTGNCTNPGNNANLGVAGGTAGTTALATERYFFARVEVCSVVGTQLQDTRKFNGESYCVKYPNGNYKPVGNLQKFSDSMRVAVFGYLNQSDNQRYGGVLRAPMKYVGPTQFDGYGVQMPAKNPQVEWSEQNGVFEANPLGDAMGISGVVNYINKFGRTGNPTGVYKTFDPVGELYYEALRYLQGLGPTVGTSQATSPTFNMTAAHKDGFPVYETWTDPHATGSSSGDYTCLRNNLFTIADIGTHPDKYIPGNPAGGTLDAQRVANVANNEPDFAYWTKVVGAFEAGAGFDYKVGPESSSRTVRTYNPNPDSGNYRRYPEFYTSGTNNLSTMEVRPGSQAAFYIAGMAYWARNHDIRGSDWTAQPSKQRPGMRVKTYMLDVNENAASSATDTRRKSQLFLAAKYGGFADESGIGNPYLTKDAAGSSIAALSDTADPSATTKYVSNNAVWDKSNTNNFDPAQPGEAGSHFLASDGRAILRTLNNIFASIARDGVSVAGGAISTQRLTSVGGFVYQALFDAADWTGDLVSQYVRVTNNVASVSSGTLTDPHQWRAAEKLQARIAADPDASWRNVVVGKTSPTASATATAFLWNQVDTDVQTALSKATPSASADLRGEDRLNFIRGVRTLEGTTVSGTPFRKRGGLLGDILNSGVAYSGAPTANQAGAVYKAFFDANKNRAKALFVGANDGMLHAFNAADGEELFAYIPSWVVGKLPALTAPGYNAGGHQSYVDGTPAVSEAEVGTAGSWKTVLVSGTGAGGQGVFALDVTDPSAFDATKVLWEFTDRDDPDLGNVIGRPQILKFRTSAPSASTPTFKWFAVVPGGVNNNANDAYFSTTGKPALFLLDLGKSASQAWQEGVNYYKVSLPAGSTTLPSGVVNFSATGGVAGEVQQIYLGDLQGNLWKLNFAANGTAGWNLDTLSFFKTTGATPTAIPFFIAKDATGVVQPITTTPGLTRGPNGGVIVLVGTGKYLETADNVVTNSTQKQSVYALLDTGSPVADSATPSSAIAGRGRLKEGLVTNSTGQVSTQAFTWGRATSDADTTQRSGWFIDFPNRGERQVSGYGILGTKLVFGSLIPPDQFADPCGGGSGYQYFANIATGSGTRSVSQVGLLGEPYVLELGEGELSLANATGRRTKTTKGQIFLQGSEGIQVVVGDGAGGAFSNESTIGRLSWRQIPNYAELRSNVP